MASFVALVLIMIFFSFPGVALFAPARMTGLWDLRFDDQDGGTEPLGPWWASVRLAGISHRGTRPTEPASSFRTCSGRPRIPLQPRTTGGVRLHLPRSRYE